MLERKLNVTRLNLEDEIVTISNNTILNSYVNNFGRQVREGYGLILHTRVTIGYNAA